MHDEMAVHFRVTQFLYREAQMLDDRLYAKWLELWDTDMAYRVCLRNLRDMTGGDSTYAVIDDDSTMLRARVAQLTTPNLTKAENPPSLTRRIIGNIQLSELTDSSATVLSNLIVSRVRGTSVEGTLYCGCRVDRLHIGSHEIRLVRRDVTLDQTMLLNGALTTFL